MAKTERKKEREGRFYRAVFEDYVYDTDGPLSSRSGQGRFHDKADGPTTYLAVRPETAWKEVEFHWHPAPETYRMVEVSAKVKRVADLTDPAIRRTYDVNITTLVGDDHEPCRRLARRLRAEGFEALWTFSRADQPQGRQLVVFLDRLNPGSYVRVKKVRPIKEAKSFD